MITPSFSLTATERVLPKMVLDFTTATLDPRVTFTRALATATRVNASGLVETIAADTPRFDYDPVTLACKGLLIEESRTNLCLYSEQIDNAWWIKSQLNVTGTPPWVNVAIAPDGISTADKLIEDTSGTAHRILSSAIPLTTGVAYSFSFYVKNAGRDYCYIRLNNSGGDIIAGTVQISTATVTQTQFGIISATAVGNGWTRVAGAGTSAATANTNCEVRISNTPTYAAYTGDGTSGIYIWGAQLEAGAFPTSYIPTTTAAVTRNADVATMTGTNFSSWYNASEGTFAVEFLRFTGSVGELLGLGQGTFDTTLRVCVPATSQIARGTGTSFPANVDIGGFSGISSGKVALAYKVNNYAGSANGAVALTDLVATAPTGATLLEIGRTYASNSLNGYVNKINYYPLRLSNSQVQALSK